jgi:hypothetical protein
MIEMAPETAKRCKERSAKVGVYPPTERFEQPFRRPSDVVHLSGYFVAKDLKAGWLAAPSLRVSEQMAPHTISTRLIGPDPSLARAWIEAAEYPQNGLRSAQIHVACNCVE